MSRPEWVVVCSWEQPRPPAGKARYAHQRFFADQRAAWEWFRNHRDDPHPAPTRMVLIDRRRGEQLDETGP